MPEKCLVTCGHCSGAFSFDKSSNSLARCPHCRKVSSIGSKFSRRRAIMYFVIGVLFLLSEIGLATGFIGYSRIPGGINVAYFLVFLSALANFEFAYYYYRIKVSVLSSGAPV